MALAQHIRATLELPVFVVNAYLEDLSDADLLVRPYEGMNHLAWQLGHLVQSENFHVENAFPGAMPALPGGFREAHAADRAVSDDPAHFLTKAEYLTEMRRQREGTLRILDGLGDDELAGPSPEAINYLGPTLGCVFAAQSAHWMMHAGQWAVIRRRLGRPPLF